MSNNNQPGPLRERFFNTLAQNGTKKNPPEIVLIGEGSDLSNEKSINGRAKRKSITQTRVLCLLKVAESKIKTSDRIKIKTSKQIKSYWNTFYCQSKIYTANGRQYGRYCKNRHCSLCNGIRKADILNKYLPVLEKWEAPWFVTLTSKSVSKKGLKLRMEKTLVAIKLINEKYRKRNQRGDPFRLMGIKSLECNFNALTSTYNVHLHLVVSNQYAAEILKKEWLLLWTNDNDPKYRHLASPKAQYITPVGSKTKVLVELIKYGSKIFTEPDVLDKSRSLKNKKLYVRALDNILEAMRGLRIFDRFGFDLPKQVKRQASKIVISTNYDVWVFDPKSHDWINTETGLYYSTYTMTPELIDLFKNRIDFVLE